MEPLLAPSTSIPRALGRYEILAMLGRGGTANVYLGRHAGEAGFQRLYAIKVLHPHLADDDNFVDMLLDEARIAARLHHPNVVPIVDLGSQDGTDYVVMEYIEGVALSSLLRHYRDSRPPPVLVSIMLDVLSGLHAAHTLKDDYGNPMNLVHRDVSPQNILVGLDGTARIIDFGIAKAESRLNGTRPGQLKGKVAFMSPEQIRDAEGIDCRSDVFSAGIVLWTALTGRPLFQGTSDAAALNNVLAKRVEPPSQVGFKPPIVLDAVCLRALERDPERRTPTALEMEEALRAAATTKNLVGSKRDVAEWVSAAFGEEIAERRRTVRAAATHPPPKGEATRPGPTRTVSGLRKVATKAESILPPPSLGSLSLLPPASLAAFDDDHVAEAEKARDEIPTVPPPPNYDQFTEETGAAEPGHLRRKEAAPAADAAPTPFVRGRLVPFAAAAVATFLVATVGLALRPTAAPPPAASGPSTPLTPPTDAPPPLQPPSRAAGTVDAPPPAAAAPTPVHHAAERSPRPPPAPVAPALRQRPTTTTSATAAPSPASAPAPAETKKRPTNWDPDSPLPPQ